MALFSAILIGSQDKPLSWFGEDRQLLVASPDPGSLFEPGNEYLQRDIQLALAHGRLLIGSPGMLGRTHVIKDLTNSGY